MKPGHLNVDPDNLSWIETCEEPTNIEEGLSNAQLFRIDIADDNYHQIIQFLTMGVATEEFSTSQKKQLVVKALYFQLIAGQLYKLGPDDIL